MSTDTPVKTFSDHPSTPQLRLPPLSCDAHVHVFGPPDRFPYNPQRNFTPAEATKETLFALHRQLGIQRCVIVQTMVHGRDNRVVADAIAAGGGQYLGIALVAPDIDDAGLRALADQGFRGVRFNFTRHLGTGIAPDALPAFTHRLADFGLHLQVHFESPLVHELGPLLQRSAVPVVIDHMGRVDARDGIQGLDFQALCRLMDNDHFWVKVSGIDRVDAQMPLSTPPYAQGIVLAHYMVERFGAQCVWGTDWPHPNHTHVPDDGGLVDALSQIAPSANALHALLVDNPQRLYRFESPTA
jgi:2-pyrone-4,6-dicarboxylate lactonase